MQPQHAFFGFLHFQINLQINNGSSLKNYTIFKLRVDVLFTTINYIKKFYWKSYTIKLHGVKAPLASILGIISNMISGIIHNIKCFLDRLYFYDTDEVNQ